MSRLCFVLLACLLILSIGLLACPVRAERVVLRNGATLTGKITRENADEIEYRIGVTSTGRISPVGIVPSPIGRKDEAWIWTSWSRMSPASSRSNSDWCAQTSALSRCT